MMFDIFCARYDVKDIEVVDLVPFFFLSGSMAPPLVGRDELNGLWSSRPEEGTPSFFSIM
jgi:hypothetical protein